MNLKNVILGIAIIILTIFVTYYGVNTFLPKPNYEDFCTNQYTTKIPKEPGACPAVCVPVYEIVRDACVYNGCGSGCGADEVNSFINKTTCEQALNDLKCYERYDDAVKARAPKVFFIALPLGIIILVIGTFFFGVEAVGAGLMGGGVGTLIYGSGAYWNYMQNFVRFFLSLIGLVALIWFIYYWNKKMKQR